jgi:hypothetical protein
VEFNINGLSNNAVHISGFGGKDGIIAELNAMSVEHSNYWLVLMGDSLLLAEWSLELVRCQQATYMLVTLVTHELTVAVSLYTTLTLDMPPSSLNCDIHG